MTGREDAAGGQGRFDPALQTKRVESMKTPNTPLFVKTHDFNVWLLNHTRRFPKHFRYSLTQRIENLAFEFEECLYRESQRDTQLPQSLASACFLGPPCFIVQKMPPAETLQTSCDAIPLSLGIELAPIAVRFG